ncbi:serine hydrolase [Chelatococcus sp. YT9]|uniref:serine hydrolase n=1 Tax=Chelatococcus sp. YT9 TaxID=2835635 RepID=UPI001BD0404F|nr:serine hydrolase [Chelatococcus sp. YT9]MBS7699076.1 serine hydrolase [Chelatococcus sp. YT9]
MKNIALKLVCVLGLPVLASALSLASSPAARAETAPSSPSEVAALPVSEEQIDRAVGRLDELAGAILTKTGIPGLSVAVVHRGKTIYAKGFGLRKVGESAPVDADTVFQIASLSKSVGATVVARLVAQGVIAWDTPVVKHLPWFALADPWVSTHVTIGDLYAHRSGLPDHAGDNLEDLDFDQRAVLERLRFLPLHAFRSDYAYTNFGLTAAAVSAAAAAGSDWADLSTKLLYKPLGMAATSSRYADFAASSNRAVGHVKTSKGYEPLYVRQPDAQTPAGGVSSSVKDMARWMALILQNGRFEGRQLIEASALLPAISPQVVSAHPASSAARAGFYGFGFGTGIQASGRTTLSHSGAFSLGAATNYVMIPSLDIGIVVLSNAAPIGAVEALGMEFADLVTVGRITEDWYALYNRAMEGMATPVGRLVGKDRPSDVRPAEALSAYTGIYSNDYFGDAQISEDKGKLILTIGPQARRHTLEHWDGSTFVFAISGENAPVGSLSAVEFVTNDRATAEKMVVEFLDEDGTGTFRRR